MTQYTLYTHPRKVALSIHNAHTLAIVHHTHTIGNASHTSANLRSKGCRHSTCCCPTSAASAISGRTRTGCIQMWRLDDFMLLAQDADRCRYAFVHVRWHACVGVVATAHIRQQAACTEIELGLHKILYLGRLVVVADMRTAPHTVRRHTQHLSHVRTLSCNVPTVWRRPQILGDLLSEWT